MGKTRDVRKPPINAVMDQHLPQERGKCRWCGLPTDEITPGTKKLRWWHSACEDIVRLLSRPELMRAALFARDRGICAVCGEDWSQRYRFRAGNRYIMHDHREDFRRHPQGFSEGMWHYTEVVWISLWHQEHRVPLWKSRHLPPIERVKFFMLDALETVCEPCHKIKSAKETAERAHYDRMGEEPVVSEAKLKGKRPWPKRKLQSRPMRKRRKSPKAKRTISRRR